MVVTVKRSSKRTVSNLIRNFRSRILNGELAAGSALPSPDEIAKRYGVSPITASRIMARLADEGIVERIKGRGTFVADIAKTSKKFTIGVAFSIPSGDISEVSAAFEAFQRYSCQAIRQKGSDVKHLNHNELCDTELADEILSDIDAVIVSSTYMYTDPAMIKNLSISNKPVVVVQQTGLLELPFNQVVPNLYEGYDKAMELLRKNGHKKITVCSFEGEEHDVRVGQIKHCAVCNGFSPESIEVITRAKLVADLGRMTGFQIGMELIERDNCTAVLTTSDFCAFGIIDALNSKGLEVGKNLDLISFDDLEGAGLCPYGEPVLTTISFPRQKVIDTAIELLFKKLSEKDENVYSIKVPTKLIIRHSTK